MSDYYRIELRCNISADAPKELHNALSELAEGKTPDEASLEGLPGIVKEYLRPGGFHGDGVTLYFLNGPELSLRGGSDGCYTLHLTITFHDDEYFNGGIYFPYWLMQFVVDQGPIGTMQQINGVALPTILSKMDNEIIETNLAYAPDEFWPIPGQRAPDKDTPVAVKSSRRSNIFEIIESLSDFKDGFSYE